MALGLLIMLHGFRFVASRSRSVARTVGARFNLCRDKFSEGHPSPLSRPVYPRPESGHDPAIEGSAGSEPGSRISRFCSDPPSCARSRIPLYDRPWSYVFPVIRLSLDLRYQRSLFTSVRSYSNLAKLLVSHPRVSPALSRSTDKPGVGRYTGPRLITGCRMLSCKYSG